MDLQKYSKAFEIRSLIKDLDDLSLLLNYHNASVLTISNDKEVLRVFKSEEFFKMMKRIINNERERLEEEFSRL